MHQITARWMGVAMLRRGMTTQQLPPKHRLPLAKTAQKRPRFRSAEEWAALGVKVQKMAGDLPRAERETTLAFNDAETKAEVTTCRHDWMRQLERYGAVPETIQVFEHGDGEHRWYIVPKSWITKPYPKKLVPEA